MSSREDTPEHQPAPASSERGKARVAARRARLAEALRDNLRKRKAQTRRREGDDGGSGGGLCGPDRR